MEVVSATYFGQQGDAMRQSYRRQQRRPKTFVVERRHTEGVEQRRLIEVEACGPVVRMEIREHGAQLQPSQVPPRKGFAHRPPYPTAYVVAANQRALQH